MIRSEDATEFPNAQWNVTSSKEFSLVPPEHHKAILQRSYLVKVFSKDDQPFMIAGLYQPSLIDPPYLWTLMTSAWETLSPSEVRSLVWFARQWATTCQTFVELGNQKAERLARVFGFRPTATTVVIGTDVHVLHRRG